MLRENYPQYINLSFYGGIWMILITILIVFAGDTAVVVSALLGAHINVVIHNSFTQKPLIKNFISLIAIFITI